MRFLTNTLWLQLFFYSLIALFLLILREIYRFQLLNSRFGKLTTYGSCILVVMWFFLIGLIFLKIGWIPGVSTVLFQIFFIGIIYQIFHKFLIDKRKEIESFCNYDGVRKLLVEFNIEPSILKDILNRLFLFGNRKALENIKDFNRLKAVLEILSKSPKGWTEKDKFIKISNFLEYGQ